MDRKIIHISLDEKFIENAKYQFNKKFGRQNSYYILVKDLDAELNFVKDDFQTIKYPKYNLITLADQLPSNAIIVFHSIKKFMFKFILNLDKRKFRLIWMFFGMEIYNDLDLYSFKTLYAKETRKNQDYLRKNTLEFIKDSLRPILRKLNWKLDYSKKELKIEVFNRFDYIGILFKEDYYNILRFGKIKNARYLFYTYYPLNRIVDLNEKIYSKGDKILLGNSGFPTNNHIDVLKKIETLINTSTKIYVPLSYGMSEYIELIDQQIKLFENLKIIKLMKFLPIEEYNNILKTIKVFILYTRRQQGVGNTIALLWHGAKVFLSHKNTFYHYLKRIGIEVYCYETELNEISINEGLTKVQIENNRKILFKNLNENLVLERLKLQIEDI